MNGVTLQMTPGWRRRVLDFLRSCVSSPLNSGADGRGRRARAMDSSSLGSLASARCGLERDIGEGLRRPRWRLLDFLTRPRRPVTLRLLSGGRALAPCCRGCHRHCDSSCGGIEHAPPQRPVNRLDADRRLDSDWHSDGRGHRGPAFCCDEPVGRDYADRGHRGLDHRDGASTRPAARARTAIRVADNFSDRRRIYRHRCGACRLLGFSFW